MGGKLSSWIKVQDTGRTCKLQTGPMAFLLWATRRLCCPHSEHDNDLLCVQRPTEEILNPTTLIKHTAGPHRCFHLNGLFLRHVWAMYSASLRSSSFSCLFCCNFYDSLHLYHFYFCMSTLAMPQNFHYSSTQQQLEQRSNQPEELKTPVSVCRAFIRKSCQSYISLFGPFVVDFIQVSARRQSLPSN